MFFDVGKKLNNTDYAFNIPIPALPHRTIFMLYRPR